MQVAEWPCPHSAQYVLNTSVWDVTRALNGTCHVNTACCEIVWIVSFEDFRRAAQKRNGILLIEGVWFVKKIVRKFVEITVRNGKRKHLCVKRNIRIYLCKVRRGLKTRLREFLTLRLLPNDSLLLSCKELFLSRTNEGGGMRV